MDQNRFENSSEADLRVVGWNSLQTWVIKHHNARIWTWLIKLIDSSIDSRDVLNNQILLQYLDSFWDIQFLYLGLHEISNPTNHLQQA
jgi:hypothetical protein